MNLTYDQANIVTLWEYQKKFGEGNTKNKKQGTFWEMVFENKENPKTRIQKGLHK